MNVQITTQQAYDYSNTEPENQNINAGMMLKIAMDILQGTPEDLSSQCNNSTVLFTVRKGNYIASAIWVFLNGVRITNFTQTSPTAGTFTMPDAPKSDDKLIVSCSSL